MPAGMAAAVRLDQRPVLALGALPRRPADRHTSACGPDAGRPGNSRARGRRPGRWGWGKGIGFGCQGTGKIFMLPLHVERLQGARGRRAWDCLRGNQVRSPTQAALRSPRPLPAPAVPPPWSASGVGREMLSVGFVEIGELRRSASQTVTRTTSARLALASASVSLMRAMAAWVCSRMSPRTTLPSASIGIWPTGTGSRRRGWRARTAAAGAGITGDGGHGDFRKTGGMKRGSAQAARAHGPGVDAMRAHASGTGWRSTSAAASSEPRRRSGCRSRPAPPARRRPARPRPSQPRSRRRARRSAGRPRCAWGAVSSAR